MNNILELNTQNTAQNQIDNESVLILVKFFDLLIKIDQKIKKEVGCSEKK